MDVSFLVISANYKPGFNLASVMQPYGGHKPAWKMQSAEKWRYNTMTDPRRKPINKMLKSEMEAYIHELLEKIDDLEDEIVHLDECYGELESDNCDMYQQIQNSEPEHSLESLMHRMRIDGTLTSEFETYVDQLLMYRLI